MVEFTSNMCMLVVETEPSSLNFFTRPPLLSLLISASLSAGMVMVNNTEVSVWFSLKSLMNGVAAVVLSSLSLAAV
jgi:hypothetical protein